MKKNLISLIFVLLFISSVQASVTGQVTLPATEESVDIIKKTAALEKSAIVLIATRISGEIIYPDFEIVHIAEDTGIIGTWQTEDETITFSEDGTFIGNSVDVGALAGTYSITGNTVTINYTLPFAGTAQFTFEVEGNMLTLSHPDIDTVSYAKISSPEHEEDILTETINSQFVPIEGPTAQMIIETIETGASGSGFIVHPNGYIITNAHVVSFSEEEKTEWIINQYFSLVQQGMIEELSTMYNISTGEKEQIAGILLEKFTNYIFTYASIDNLKVESFALNGVTIQGQNLTIDAWPVEIKKIGEVEKQIAGEWTWGRDVAIIKVNKTNLPTVKLGNSETVSTRDQLFVLC